MNTRLLLVLIALLGSCRLNDHEPSGIGDDLVGTWMLQWMRESGSRLKDSVVVSEWDDSQSVSGSDVEYLVFGDQHATKYRLLATADGADCYAADSFGYTVTGNVIEGADWSGSDCSQFDTVFVTSTVYIRGSVLEIFQLWDWHIESGSMEETISYRYTRHSGQLPPSDWPDTCP